MLQPPSLTAHASNRVCNALALLQCVASHPETRSLFLQGAPAAVRRCAAGDSRMCRDRVDLAAGTHPALPLLPARSRYHTQPLHPLVRLFPPLPRPAAHIPLFLYPFLNTISKTRPFEYLRLTSLGVIGALVKVRAAAAAAAASWGWLGAGRAPPRCCRAALTSTAAPSFPPLPSPRWTTPRSSTSCCPPRSSRCACAPWRRAASCPRRWPPSSCRRSCCTAWASPTSAPPPSASSPWEPC